jgi:hypothetical protein
LPHLLHCQFLKAVFFNKGFQKRFEDLAIFFRQCISLYELVNELCVSDFAGQTIFTIFKQIIK